MKPTDPKELQARLDKALADVWWWQVTFFMFMGIVFLCLAILAP